MHGIQNSPFFLLALLGLLAILAVLPTLIALARGADDIGYLILVNVICCATVFGWPIALIAAIAWPRRHPPSTWSPALPPPPHWNRSDRGGPYA
ncbi:superinfection immunity protein [Actinomadura latina]|uniref:Superinfection immunity protein n=1 Tax=Actinomadura latina TaxID=163603 RepID=A0A846YXR5_9ACTN|nr:superinfection immunity protein [Actinomadura latina]NKZ03278.1 superinfection immunity protein [Actinomadura latina]